MDTFRNRVYGFLDSQFYLRPVDRSHADACEVCGGTKGGKQYLRCYQCAAGADALPGQLGFGFYALKGAQDGYAMRGYKSKSMSASNTHRLLVGCLIYLGILEYQQSWGADMVATVPSLSGRIGKHPLEALAEAASRKNGGPPVKQGLLAPQETKQPRSIDPNHFLVTEDVKNQTILLVDDTWTTGSHVLSARKALMAAGGSTVDIFVVARWLRATGNFSGTALYEQAGESYSSLRGVRLFKEI